MAALIAAAPVAATGTVPARLTAAAGSVSATQPLAEVTPTSGAKAWVSYDPANPLATGRKTDIPEETRALARRAAGLVEEDESAFLGTYINDRDQVVVVAATLTGVELAQQRFAQSGVLVEQGATSINGTTELGLLVGQRSSTLAKILTTWGPSPETGGVFFELSQEPSQEERDILEATAAEKQIPIRVSVVPVAEGGTLDYRHIDYSAYQGGNRITSTNGSTTSSTAHSRCTSAFTYTIGTAKFLLTAGHCYPRDGWFDYAWIFNGFPDPVGHEQLVGTYHAATWKVYTNPPGTTATGGDSGYHGDLALIRVDNWGNSIGDRIFWGSASTTNSIPVTARIGTITDDEICLNGSRTGTDCAGLYISATNVNITYPSGEVILQGDRAVDVTGDHCPIPGDSGGSVVFDHANQAETEALGIGVISGWYAGTNGGCFAVFTSAGEAVEAWGGELNF
ncbi:MAG: S1 family peptidase [Candidatus Nanopelagicales bacterium]|nr:S1 family peptidase [Candidatus Nanopelagicales bacterium]